MPPESILSFTMAGCIRASGCAVSFAIRSASGVIHCPARWRQYAPEDTESLTLATPVSTTVGAEGLGFLTGQHLLADTPAAFAGAVIRLLRERIRRDYRRGTGRTSGVSLVQDSRSRPTLVDDWLAVRWRQNADKQIS
jgi:hypothetical protein